MRHNKIRGSENNHWAIGLGDGKLLLQTQDDYHQSRVAMGLHDAKRLLNSLKFHIKTLEIDMVEKLSGCLLDEDCQVVEEAPKPELAGENPQAWMRNLERLFGADNVSGS